MRRLSLLFFSVFALSVQAQSQDGSEVLALAVAELPPCALQCTLVTIGQSTCELTDIACIKTNKQLLGNLTVCVKLNCTIRNALTARRFLQHLLDAPVRDNSKIGTYTCLIVGGVAVLTYLLRVVARLPMFGAGWGPDDWVITLATMIIIPLTVCAELLNQIGLGKDMWEVPHDNITKILEIFYFTELLYLTAIGLTKISILLFYLRIFPQRGLRRAIQITIILCILYIITFVTATGLQCLPIHIAWDHWDGEHEGTCINLNADAWASAGVNIVLDLIVIILPIREVSRLSMSHRRRFGVMAMFLLGGFVTIVSILRLKYMVQFAHTENVTWDYLPIGIWSAVESHVGLIVACMPAMRSLVRSMRDCLFPKPATSVKYSDDPKSSIKKNGGTTSRSHFWSSATAIGTLTRSKHAKEDFMELDEYEMRAGTKSKNHETDDMSFTEIGSDRSPNIRIFSRKSDEEIQPLAATSAPTGKTPDGILVQTEYSVDRASIKSRSAEGSGNLWQH